MSGQQQRQSSYAGRAPYIGETGNGPIGADSEAKWMISMLRMTAGALFQDAERDARTGKIDKYRTGQLEQRRRNLNAAAEFIDQGHKPTVILSAPTEPTFPAWFLGSVVALLLSVVFGLSAAAGCRAGYRAGMVVAGIDAAGANASSTPEAGR